MSIQILLFGLLLFLEIPQIILFAQHAIASTYGDKYYGTKATFNLWQPTVERGNDFSLAQIWIRGGSYQSNDLNTIEAGWQVRPRKEKRKSTFVKVPFILHSPTTFLH